MENIIYYIFTYLLVIGIRFFKLKVQLKEEFKSKWYELFNVSLEIVYTASGLVIALLLNVPKGWIAAVVVMYLFVVIVSALLEMSHDFFKPISRTIIHFLVLLIVFGTTIICYSKVLPKVDINGNPTERLIVRKESTYTVIIPYKDLSLYQYVNAGKLSERRFYLEMRVKSFTQDSAVILALQKTYSDSLVRPMYSNKKDLSSKQGIQIIEEDAIAFIR